MTHITWRASFVRTTNLLAATVAGLLAGAAPSMADDTDIYVGAEANRTGVRPNVLFILDTSGSMGTQVGSGSNAPTRMQEMQTAFRNVLTNVSDINAGLMRFHRNEGGPILFPVTDLEQTVAEPLVYRVARNNDDGAETLHNDEVKLNETQLLLGVSDIDVPPGVSQKPFNIRMLPGANMSERRIGNLNTNPPTESGGAAYRRIGSPAYALAQQNVAPFVGMRFENLPADMAGARIDDAVIQMTPIADFGNQWQLRVRGHALAEEPPLVDRYSNDTLCSNLAADEVALMDAACRHFRSPQFAGNSSEQVMFGGFSGLREDKLQIRVKNLLQPIVNTPGFTGNAVGFSTGAMSTENNLVAVYGSHPDFNSSLYPELRGNYTPGAGQGSYARPRRVALRFRDVRIPQGSIISDARLEFTPLSDSDDPMSLQVSFLASRREGGSGALQPNEFTTANRALSSLRGGDRGAATVRWDVPRSEMWTADSSVVTRDLSKALNPVVKDADWCGGNDLVVLLEPTPDTMSRPGSRDVASIDHTPVNTGESFSAPRLHIQLEAGARQGYGPGEGCTVGTKTLRPAAGADDARSNKPANINNASQTRFDNSSDRIDADREFIGMRFPAVPVPRDAVIQKAELYVRALSDYPASHAGAVKFEVYADATGNSGSFGTSDTGPHARSASTARVDSNALPLAAVAGLQEMLLADVTGPVQEVIQRSDWQDGNALSLIGRRLHQNRDVEFLTYDANPEAAARLSIEFQYNVGDLTVQPEEVGVSVREHLIQLVDDLTANGDTPTIDTYFEAARYFRGEGVHYGLTRAGHHDREIDQRSGNPFTFSDSHARRSRISHRRSWTSANAPLPAGCDSTNYNSWDCRLEQVEPNSMPVYNSPIEDSCQGNYIVLLTDGIARLNYRTDLEETLIGKQCVTSAGRIATVNQGQMCGVDIAAFLNTEDQSPLPGAEPQTVQTHTIRFGDDSPILEEIAKAGGGSYEVATTASDLETVFNNLFASIRGSRSFTPPALSTSAFNDLYTDEHVFLSMFEPALKQGWSGNLKKYSLCHTSLGTPDANGNLLGVGCSIGEVLDSTGVSATSPGGTIKDTAISHWTGFADGAKVTEGGAVTKLRQATLEASRRTVYMYPDTLNPPQDQTGSNKGKLFPLIDESPVNPDGSKGDGIIDYFTGDPLTGAIETGRLLGMAAVTADDRDAMNRTIRWARGEDTEDEVGNETGPGAVPGSNMRYAMGDPLHASPVVVNYGISSSTGAPIAKLFVPTNDGAIRMIDASSGIEEWAFYPQATLRKQNPLRQGRAGNRVYGLDSTPVVWIRDTGVKNVIDPSDGDYVRLVFGMRRGGSHYYALDVTPSQVIDSPQLVASTTPSIEPEFLWRIDGGSGDFGRLGQTWSRPRLGNIRIGRQVSNQSAKTETRVALFFAGGYDETQDAGFTAEGAGNALYVVDAETGERLFYASGIGALAHGLGRGLTVPGMNFPIPSDPTILDVDGDGTVDRLVVGDAGGQVWRMDLRALPGVNNGLEAVVGRIASTSFDKTLTDYTGLDVKPADRRKFFYSPAVYRATGDNIHSGSANYDLVVIGSGNRADPLNEDTRDRLFFLRDTRSGSLFSHDTDNDGIADGMKPGGGESSKQTIFTGLASSFDSGKTGEILTVGQIDPDVSTGTGTGSSVGQRNLGSFTGATPRALQRARGFAAELDSFGEKALARPLLIAGKVVFTTYKPVEDAATANCGGAEGVGQLHVLNLRTGGSVSDSIQLGSGIPSQPAVFFRNLGKKPGANDPAGTLLVGTGGGTGSFDLPGLFDNPNKSSFGGSYRQIDGGGGRMIEFGLYWYEDPDN